MWIPQGWEWDPARWARAIRTHQQVRNRVEVWRAGTRLSSAAPFSTGEVTDQRVVAGQRRSLTLTVPESWQRWFDDGFIELRVFSGLRLSRGLVVECPLGRFPVLRPKRVWPAQDITINAVDYWQRVVNNNFGGPVMSPGGRIVNQAAQLMLEAGVGWPEITATNTSSAEAVLLEGTRTEAVAGFMESTSAEAWIDREGVARIVDSQIIGVPTSATDGNTESSALEPDWEKVYNQVAVRSSAQDVDFGTVTATIGYDAHPASPRKLGYVRTYNYSSPLLMNSDQGKAAASTLLQRVSALSQVYTYTCIPDPTRDAGDTIEGKTVSMIDTITHPLSLDGRQVITTVPIVETIT